MQPPLPRAIGQHTGDAAVVVRETDHLVLHAQFECREKDLRPVREELEEVPLRHQRDELAVRGHMPKIRALEVVISDDATHRSHALMWNPQKFFEQAELVDHLEARRMHGIAAEVAEEVGVLFQHGDADAAAGEEIAQHHACRSASGDTAFGFERFVSAHGVRTPLPGVYRFRRLGCGRRRNRCADMHGRTFNRGPGLSSSGCTRRSTKCS